MTALTHMESLEISQLDLRYGHTRIRRPEALLPLMRSLEKWGQLRPVSVVRSDAPCHVLVDGYLRVEALRRCGKDTVLAEVWVCGEMEALVAVLIREQERRWEALEEASLIRELHDRHELSQESIARLLGKDKSWVCRRLSLLSALPDEILEAVRSGHLSTWAAGRILAPFRLTEPGACQGPYPDAFTRASFHPGVGGVVPSLPEGQSQAKGEDGARSGPFSQSASSQGRG